MSFNDVNYIDRRGAVLDNKRGVYEMAMPDDDQHTLTLTKVKHADVGEFMFVASNKHGSVSCTFSVEMAGGPHLPHLSCSCRHLGGLD